jgi:hypothetical protein
MVNNCANPQCNKPLHYLRDGRIFVFDVASARLGPDGKRLRNLEHYWLCGDCAPSMIVEWSAEMGVSVQAKQSHYRPGSVSPLSS